MRSSDGLRQLPSGKWQASYYDPHGKRRFKAFERKGDAQRWRREQLHSRDRGDWMDPTSARATVGDLADAWLEAAKVRVRPSTWARYDGIVRTHVQPAWRTVTVGQVKPSDVKAWTAQMDAGGLSGASIRKNVLVLSQVLKDAVGDGRITRNPCDGVVLPKPVERQMIVLKPDEVEQLAKAAGRYRLHVLVLAWLGLRFGELVALRVADVEFLRRRIHVHASASNVNGTPTIGTTKSGKGRRVPVPAFLLEELARHCEGRALEDLVFPPYYDDGYLRNSVFRRSAFDKAAQAIGKPGLTPHGLRHTAASLAIHAGANIKAVQRMLGHADASITLNRYGHLYEDDLDAVAERMDALHQGGSTRAVHA